MTIVDVSYHQGMIDWAKVKQSVDVAILRCGYGTDKPSNDDKKFVYNATECERLGIPYGVYLYSYAKTTDAARSEAQHALRLLKGRKISGHVWFDAEQKGTESVSAACANTFCEIVQAAGYKVGVYTGHSWFNSYMKSLKDWPLWIARYGKNNGQPSTQPSIGRDFLYWQYTSKGIVAGIKGAVDLSKSMSTATTPVTPVKTPTVDVATDTTRLVYDTLKGKYGAGLARRAALGARYQEVQNVINHVYKADKNTLASETMQGKYGSGDIRKTILGSRYNEVMAVINNSLPTTTATPAKKSNEEIAKLVMNGAYGRNPERAEKLRAEGYDPNAIQAIINKWYGTTTTKAPATTNASTSTAPQSFEASLSGTYKTIGSSVRMRKTPSTSSAIVATIRKKGTAVSNYGYYSDVSGYRWYYVQYQGKTGFIRGDLIKK